MKTVLVVDDEPFFRELIAEALFRHDNSLNILTAVNGKDAVKILGDQNISCVVTDLNMPEVDGYQLIAFMSMKFPHIPIVVVTGFGTPAIEKKVHDINTGSLQYLEKPFNVEILIEMVDKAVKHDSSGFIKGIALPSFLQLLEMERKTCTLTVRADGKTAMLYFRKGTLIDAVYRDWHGEEAFYHILTWPKVVEIEFDEDGIPIKRERTIDKPLNFLLMEGLRIKDEHEMCSQQPGDIKNKNEWQGENEASWNSDEATAILKQKVDHVLKKMEGALYCIEIFNRNDGKSVFSYANAGDDSEYLKIVLDKVAVGMRRAEVSGLHGYYLLHLENRRMAVMIHLGKYQWGMVWDRQKIEANLLINAIIPSITGNNE